MNLSMRSFLLSGLKRSSSSRPRLRLEQVGNECVRATYYAATGAPIEAVPNERLMKLAIGHTLDELALRFADGLRSIAHVPVKVAMGGFTVRGVADLLLYDKSGPALVSDLQVVGDDGDGFRSRPHPEHTKKVNIYAWGLGCPRWSVCYVHAGSGELVEHFGDTDEFAAKRDFGGLEEAAYWTAKGVPPPRPYEDEELTDGTVLAARAQYPCLWCPHNQVCWEEK